MTFEYLSKVKSEALFNEGASTGFGDDIVFSLDVPGMIKWRVGASKRTPFASFCFFIFETMTGIPPGVVTLISDSVSTEVEALISDEGVGEDENVVLLVNALSEFIVLNVSGRVGALFRDS
jgi:hypothetical protein